MTRCKLLGAQLKILGAQLKKLVSPIKNQKAQTFYNYSFICMLSFLLDESVFVPTFRLSLYVGDNNNTVTFFF